MLTIQNITLLQGTKVLIENSSVALHEKQKIGLVGRNGCGKSSLFSFLLGKLHADQGELHIDPRLRISHLSQELPDTSETAIDFVVAGDDVYHDLQVLLKQAEAQGNHEQVMVCHDLLNQTGGYSKTAMAASILSGLGFSADAQSQSVNQFSGGWRMRLNLARCLMKPAELLLLDEPTNHLDLEAIVWLEKWLKRFSGSVILISHDRDFLDGFVTHILHIVHKQLELYTGNYSEHEKIRAQQMALQQAQYQKQQQKINHMMEYVNKFRAQATKAKQAQSRLKSIAKMEILVQAQIDSPFSFSFYPCLKAKSPLLACDKVKAGFNEDKPILKNVNFNLNPGDRIALLGANGEGKSTLIKTLTSQLPLLGGLISRSSNLKIGYYAQHQLEQLDCDLSPVELLQKIEPNASEQTIRDFLGGFNFIGDDAVNTTHHFSGGEKARLVLAKLVWEKPNLLLLDEPTNHLDLDMRAAVEMALQTFDGAIILVSHDRHLLRCVVDEYYLVANSKLAQFVGDLDTYQQSISTPEKDNTQVKSKNKDSYEQKKSLQNKLKKLESLVEKIQKQVKSFESKLAEPSIYDAVNSNELQDITNKHKIAQQQLEAAEEEWLEVIGLLDS